MQNNHKIQTKNYKLVLGGGLMLILSLGLAFSFSILTSSTQSILASPAPESMEPVPPLVAEWVPEPPVRLVIPSIAVDAKIQYVGVADNSSGEMDVPSNFTDVGWYKHGVRPGMKGSAVIAGHLKGKEVPEAVFYNLDKLQVGDEVVIRSAERIEDIFRVVRIKTYGYDEETDEVFVSDDGKKRLNLITCGGEWLSDKNVYDERTVVFTELMTDVE